MRTYRRVDGGGETERARRQYRGRFVNAHWDDEGMLVLSARLPADQGAAVMAALEAAEEALFKEEQKRARAAEKAARDVSAETRSGAQDGKTGTDTSTGTESGTDTAVVERESAEPHAPDAAVAKPHAPERRASGADGQRPAEEGDGHSDTETEAETETETHTDSGGADAAFDVGADEKAAVATAPTASADTSSKLRTIPGLRVSAETPPTAEQRRADALALVAQSALSHALHRAPSGDRHQIMLHVDAEVLGSTTADAHGPCHLHRGPSVSAETARRLACDAAVVTITHAPDGTVLDVGRKTRTIPPAIRRALRTRDHLGCAFPGCTHDRFLEAHHLEHWAAGGPTNLDNLVQLCPAHHHALHEGGFTAEPTPEGPRFFDRQGNEIPASPPSAPRLWQHARPAEPSQPLVRQLDLGHMTEKTLPPGSGDRLDLAWAVDGLLRQRVG